MRGAKAAGRTWGARCGDPLGLWEAMLLSCQAKSSHSKTLDNHRCQGAPRFARAFPRPPGSIGRSHMIMLDRQGRCGLLLTRDPCVLRGTGLAWLGGQKVVDFGRHGQRGLNMQRFPSLPTAYLPYLPCLRHICPSVFALLLLCLRVLGCAALAPEGQLFPHTSRS